MVGDNFTKLENKLRTEHYPEVWGVDNMWWLRGEQGFFSLSKRRLVKIETKVRN